MGHAPFHSKEFVVPGSLGGQLCCFSAGLRFLKGFHYVLTNSFHLYFKPTRITRLRPKFASLKLNTGSIQVYSLHFSYTSCFWLLKLCSRGYGQTNKYTNIHTYTHTFWKTILVNQAHAHSRPLAGYGHTPGLKTL